MSELKFLTRSAEVFLPKAQTESTNAIIMVNVLEHIEDDGSALEYIYKILKPGGSLLLFVPALQFLYSQLDHDHGHFRRYSKSGLIKVACDAGFSIDQVQFIDLLGMMPWLVFNKWMKKTEFDENMVLLYDRYAVPVTKKIETLLGSPIGKNLILVAKKPASRN